MTVRAKWTLSMAGISVTGLLALSVAMGILQRRAEDALRDAAMVQAVVLTRHVTARVAATAQKGQSAEEVERVLDAELAQRPEVKGLTVLRADGSVLATRGAALPPAVTSRLLAGDRTSATDASIACGRCHRADVLTFDGAAASAAPLEIGGRPAGRVLSVSRDDRSAHLVAASRVTLFTVLPLILLAVGLGAYLLGARFTTPLRALADLARRIGEGDFSGAELTVASRDEVGEMATSFNQAMRSLRALATAADAASHGDLTVELGTTGPVTAAFSRMIEGQRRLVRQISETSVQLGSAAAEIYAAAQEQEAAAAQQAAGVEEVSHSMDSLLGSAAHIADTASGVLANAERNRDTTDGTSKRIAELGTHTGRMGELLEEIREIADRSDLLALNASLEATRAGEAGQAFALVAGEMRRLAERVMGSVEGVKTLVADVRAFGSSTVLSMDEARKLAESTTGSARQITLVTQQQRTATEQISQSMRAIAAVLGQSATAAQETRSSAEVLKTQAEHLAQVVGQFHLDRPAAG